MSSGWKTAVDNGVIDWLLEDENPAVRAAALIGLMDHPPDDPEIATLHKRELGSGVSGRVLGKMEPDGYWGRPQDFYVRSKYHGTVWSFLLLCEIGSAFADVRLRQAAEFLLLHAQRKDNGGFTYANSSSGSARPAAFPCLSGNLVWAMSMAGMVADPRLMRAVAWLAENQYLRDGPGDESGAKISVEKEKSFLESCWGSHTCMMGVVKSLKALAAWPEEIRTPAMQQAIDAGVDFLLKHNLIYRSHEQTVLAKAEFLKFGFPLFWRTDAIEMLEVLLALNINSEAMFPALHAVTARQGTDGRWIMEQSFNGRMQVRVEKDNRPSKWVTLRALKVIKLAGEVGLPV